jgi:hypothetical protein
VINKRSKTMSYAEDTEKLLPWVYKLYLRRRRHGEAMKDKEMLAAYKAKADQMFVPLQDVLLDQIRMLEAAVRRLKEEAAKDIEAMEQKDRVVVSAKAWQEWFIVGQEDGLRKAKNPNGDLVRAVDAYVEWCYPGITSTRGARR